MTKLILAVISIAIGFGVKSPLHLSIVLKDWTIIDKEFPVGGVAVAVFLAICALVLLGKAIESTGWPLRIGKPEEDANFYRIEVSRKGASGVVAATIDQVVGEGGSPIHTPLPLEWMHHTDQAVKIGRKKLDLFSITSKAGCDRVEIRGRPRETLTIEDGQAVYLEVNFTDTSERSLAKQWVRIEKMMSSSPSRYRVDFAKPPEALLLTKRDQ